MGALLVLGSYYGLTRSDRAVETSWVQLRRIVQRQLDLVSELTPFVKEALPSFQKAVRRLEASQQALLEQHGALARPIAQPQLDAYEKAHQRMTDDLERILRTAADIGPFAEGERFSGWMGQYQGTQKLLTDEKRRYDSLAMAYNRLYHLFFVYWVAERFEFQSRPLFQ